MNCKIMGISGGVSALLAVLCAAISVPVSAQTVIRYVHTDALGSIVALTDSSGAVIERREYEPYGSQLTPGLTDGPGFTGHVQDAATGLTYMQQRYYDPQLGTFLSTDPVTPVGNPSSQFNRYRYANSNPYRFMDPDGRTACGKDWDCRMSQQSGSIAFRSSQVAQVARDPDAAIAKFNSIPNRQNSAPESVRYFARTGGLVTRASGREVHADIVRLSGSVHTAINYFLGDNNSVEVMASYAGPGTRVAIAHTHPGDNSFSGRPAVYSSGWRGGFHRGDLERSLAATMVSSGPVDAYVVGAGGGIQKFDMNRMWGAVNSNDSGYHDADDYISDVK